MEIPIGQPFELGTAVVGIGWGDRRAQFVQQEAGKPPHRIDGLSIGAPELTGDAPHDGEVHPDGDELLFLVSGAVTVRLELPDGERLVELRDGDALVVPQGVWHKVTLREPGRLTHITPGPNGEARLR
jgi:mannose-6-phosphate isomerase-like protein (cupin superfamily)